MGRHRKVQQNLTNPATFTSFLNTMLFRHCVSVSNGFCQQLHPQIRLTCSQHHYDYDKHESTAPDSGDAERAGPGTGRKSARVHERYSVWRHRKGCVPEVQTGSDEGNPAGLNQGTKAEIGSNSLTCLYNGNPQITDRNSTLHTQTSQTRSSGTPYSFQKPPPSL